MVWVIYLLEKHENSNCVVHRIRSDVSNSIFLGWYFYFVLWLENFCEADSLIVCVVTQPARLGFAFFFKLVLHMLSLLLNNRKRWPRRGCSVYNVPKLVTVLKSQIEKPCDMCCRFTGVLPVAEWIYVIYLFNAIIRFRQFLKVLVRNCLSTLMLHSKSQTRTLTLSHSFCKYYLYHVQWTKTHHTHRQRLSMIVRMCGRMLKIIAIFTASILMEANDTEENHPPI